MRKDLETTTAVEQRLIEDNLNRRQLTKLEVARCYLRLRELEGRTKVERRGTGDLRDFFGQRFHVSGRTLDRWVNVLKTPVEVQQACDAGAISLVLATQVSELPDKAQGQIAEQIAAGEEPQSVIRKYLQQKSSPQCPLASAVTRLSGLLSARYRTLIDTRHAPGSHPHRNAGRPEEMSAAHQ